MTKEDKAKFCCDECPVNFKCKKKIKKHKKEHNFKKDTDELKNDDINPYSVILESILNCTATCDCVDEWVY